MDKINYHGLTPASVYSEDRTNFTYDHDVQVYYDDLALVDKDGKPLYITAYIGVKGDANLDNVCDGSDAADVLSYFARVGALPDGGSYLDVQLSSSPLVTSGSDPLEELACFLCDVTEDEWGETNYNLSKINRTIDGTDAGAILYYYGLAGMGGGPSVYYECWNKACPNRFGGTIQ